MPGTRCGIDERAAGPGEIFDIPAPAQNRAATPLRRSARDGEHCYSATRRAVRTTSPPRPLRHCGAGTGERPYAHAPRRPARGENTRDRSPPPVHDARQLPRSHLARHLRRGEPPRACLGRSWIAGAECPVGVMGRPAVGAPSSTTSTVREIPVGGEVTYQIRVQLPPQPGTRKFVWQLQETSVICWTFARIGSCDPSRRGRAGRPPSTA